MPEGRRLGMAGIRSGLKKLGIIGIMLALLMSYSVQYSFAVDDSGVWGPTTHVGKYYFRFSWGGNGHLYMSKKKNSGFKKVPVTDPFFVTNGKIIMFIAIDNGNYCIKSYTISSKKVSKVKQLPDGTWEIVSASGSYLWLTDFENTYRYDIRTGKLKRYKKNVYIDMHLYGAYYLCYSGDLKYSRRNVPVVVDNGNGYTTTSKIDISYQKAAIYKITKGGKFKKVRSLGKVNYVSADSHEPDNYGKVKSFYYTTGGAHKIYRIKYNGKGRKKIRSFDGYVSIMSKKYCYVYDNNKEYKYYYKTGKRVISN